MKKRPSRTVRPKNSLAPFFVKYHDLGVLQVPCPYCKALHFKGEIRRCCDNGKVQLPEWKKPVGILMELFEQETKIARAHLKYINALNTLLSFASKQFDTEELPGKGVPIVKVKGTIIHAASPARPRPGVDPAFGSLHTFADFKEATAFRMANRVSKGIDYQVSFLYRLFRILLTFFSTLSI